MIDFFEEEVHALNLVMRIKIWGKVLACYFLTFFGVKASVYSAETTVEVLLNGKSLIRFGDGEFGIYRGKDIHYQKWSPELKTYFNRIKEEYESGNEYCRFLLAVPKRFMSINGVELAKKRVYVSSWAESRYDFKKNYRHDIPYGDSFLFEKNNREIYAKLWNSEKCPANVVFVHNSEKYAKQFADTYGKNTVFVQCPGKNAFAMVDELEREIESAIQENGWAPGKVMLTISAGPAGKVLVYRLSKKGYWCIDAGHCWDDPLES